MPVPTLTITLAAFAVMLILARLKVPLGWAILIGAVAFGFMLRLAPMDIFTVSLRGISQPMSLALLIILTLLLMVSETMRQNGQLEEIVAIARMLLRRPVAAMAVLPALIGLLPMPAGAIFSAPMVAAAKGETAVDGARLSAINYWWRHIWEHWWPLYPGVILAMSLTNSTVLVFALFQFPLSVFMILNGFWLFRRLPQELVQVSRAPESGPRKPLLEATAGIWVILVVWGLGTALQAWLWPAPGVSSPPAGYRAVLTNTIRDLGPLILGMFASLVWVVRTRPLPAGALRKIANFQAIAPLIGLVMSVMVFQNLLAKADAARRIAVELNAIHIPVILVVIILPFVAGMITGVAFGFVGVSFPIVLELVRALPDHPASRPYAVLAYACGHLGMMISPIHLCYVVSNQYFKTSFGAVYRYIGWSIAGMTLLAALYCAVLFWVMR